MFGQRGAYAILADMWAIPRRGLGGIGLSFLVCLLGLHGCRQETEPVPPQLIGAWRTSAPQYLDSTLEVSKDLVVFRRDNGLRLSSRIVQFETLHERAESYYRLTYRDDDRNDYHLLVRYDGADGGTLIFKNQPALIWKRTGANL